MSQPGSPRTSTRPRGPASPMPMPPFILRERQRLLAGRSDRSGRWPSRVCRIGKPARAQGLEHALDGPDAGAGEGDVVAEQLDVAALAAEVGLHVDDDEGGVLGAEVAVVGPGVGIGGDERRSIDRLLRQRPMTSSAGWPARLRRAELVATMMTSVRT